jgi:poly(glycerol-phosphate) alpha-glucosyltransferase
MISTAQISSPAVAARPFSMLFCTGSLYDESSGPYLSLLQTATTLKQRGHQVTVVGTRDHWNQVSPRQWAGIDAQAFRKIGPASMHMAPALARWLRQPHTFDVVSLQSVWLCNHALVAKWCRKHRVPYMVTVHGAFNEVALSISGWRKKLAMRGFAREVLDHATCVHALTEAEYDNIRRFGLKQPVCIIPNGIELPDLAALPSVSNSIPSHLRSKRTCLYLGRLHPIKALDRLILAWSQLGAATDGWQLVLAGDDTDGYRSKLQSLIREQNLESVQFVGPVTGEVKQAWLRAADFLVLASHSEGFAMTPLEAMSVGTPVLLTETCNFPEAAQAGAGVQVPSTMDGVREGLLRIMQRSPEELQKMGGQGLELVREHYGWQTICSQLEQVYGWMLGELPPPACLRK